MAYRAWGLGLEVAGFRVEGLCLDRVYLWLRIWAKQDGTSRVCFWHQ